MRGHCEPVNSDDNFLSNKLISPEFPHDIAQSRLYLWLMRGEGMPVVAFRAPL